MALLISATDWQTATGQTLSGTELAALAVWCTDVDAAIRRAIRPFVPEPTTYTDVILDAPPTENLILPVVPVRSITSLYLHPGANGDPSAFTAADLLTPFSDYFLPVDPVDGYSRSGIVRRRGSSVWGAGWRREVGRLADSLGPSIGSIKVTFAGGPSAVPDDLTGAATLAVSMLMARKKLGMPVTSESWNGGSVSYAAPFLATAAIQSPDVAAILLRYQNVGVA